MASFYLKLLIFLLILVQQSHSNEALKILGVFPLHAASHFIPIGHIMRELARRGHQVHVVSHFPLNKPIPNYTDLSLAGTIPLALTNMTYAEVSQLTQSSVKQFFHINGMTVCNLLSENVFQRLLQIPKNTYDVIVVQVFTAQCFLAFGHHLNAPMVGTITTRMPDWLARPFGVPFNTATMPSLFSKFAQPMSFIERVKNTLLSNTVISQMNYLIEDEREHVEKYFGRKLNTINELYNDVALLLVNSHHSVNGIQPMPPGVIEVGGIQVHDEHQVLSSEIQQWLDDSKNGFVYFSFGSIVRIETCPPRILKAFYEMFVNIAPVRVLMKITDPTMLPPGLPDNVKTSKWLPQVAVLKHQNIKFFITHGGMVGTQEAIAHGVPMLGIPIFSDQHTNIRTYENKGIAVTLKHEEITGESLTKAAKIILNDQSYSDRTKTLATLFNDRPMKALDTAVYWIEYVARHGKILRFPPAHLSWYQYHSIDVYSFILVVLLLVLYILKRLIVFVLKSIPLQKFAQANVEPSTLKKMR